MIPKELLEKYSMASLDEEISLWGDEKNATIAWYKTFLIQTDYIPIKVIEAQVLGHNPQDYTDILKYRQIARDEINRLSATTE